MYIIKLLLGGHTMAIIYVTNQKHRADLKIYRENQKHRADMLIFVESQKHRAKGYCLCF